MNLYLPSDNAAIKINAVYFDNRAEAGKLQTGNDLLVSKIQRVPKKIWEN